MTRFQQLGLTPTGSNMDTVENPTATDLQRFDVRSLRHENDTYRDTGGVSSENASHGFLPAFRDTKTGRCYLSRFADGQPAPVHLLDGLPESAVLERDSEGRVVAAVPTLTSGFFLGDRFLTREEAAQAMAASRAGSKRAHT